MQHNKNAHKQFGECQRENRCRNKKDEQIQAEAQQVHGHAGRTVSK